MKKGDKVYVVKERSNQVNSNNTEDEIMTWEITKIGRKYVYAAPLGNPRWEKRFSDENGYFRDVQERYSSEYYMFAEKEEAEEILFRWNAELYIRKNITGRLDDMKTSDMKQILEVLKKYD